MATCTHLDTITVTELPEEVAGCEDCLRDGGKWLHLRICLSLRPRRLLRRLAQPARVQARGGRRAPAHPLAGARRASGCWCFDDEVAMIVDGISGETRIPPSPLLAG